MNSRRLLRNFGTLTLASVLGELLLFLAVVVLSRRFGEEAIGAYSFAMGYSGFFAVVADFGFYNFTIKELGRRREDRRLYLDGIFTLRWLLSALALGALLLSLPWLKFPREVVQVVLLLSLYQFANRIVFGYSAVCIALERGPRAALLEVLLYGGAALGCVAMALSTRDVVLAVAPFPIAGALVAILGHLLVPRELGAPRLLLSPGRLWRLLREAVPYWLSAVVLQLSTRSDVVFLGFLLGAAATGVYNVAYRTIMMPINVPHFVAVALLPMLSRQFLQDREGLRTLYGKAMSWMALAGVPAATGLWLVGPELIRVVFGESFAASGTVLRLLSVVLLLASASRVMAAFLMATDLQVVVTKSLWIGAAVNVAANLALIPFFGVVGAAWALILSESVLCGLSALGLRQQLGWPAFGSRLGFASAGSAAFAILLADLPFYLAIPAAVPIYAAALLAFKGIRRQELPALLALMRQPS